MAASKSKSLTALNYLADVGKHPVCSFCVAYGDDPFLRRSVSQSIRNEVLQGDNADMSLSSFVGRDVELRDVLDELRTVSLFGDRRLVEIQDADDFVQRHRAELEAYAQSPGEGGVLLLLVNSWPGNTRLAKQIAQSGLTIECKRPTAAAVRKWLTQRAKGEHQAKLSVASAELLTDLVGLELGLLDQELSKLALVTEDGEITENAIRQTAGSWRTRTVWEMLDAACDGRAADALAHLDRLLLSGEHPVGILGQISSSLRRFATAAQLYADAESSGRRMGLPEALKQAGIPPFKLRDAERQLKRMGRAAAIGMHRRLLDVDMALKGGSSAPDRARLVIEKLIAQIASARRDDPRRPAARTGDRRLASAQR